MINRYFIAYQAFRDGVLVRTAWSDISIKPIENGDDVILIQDFIVTDLNSRKETKHLMVDSVVVTFWKRFEE